MMVYGGNNFSHNSGDETKVVCLGEYNLHFIKDNDAYKKYDTPEGLFICQERSKIFYRKKYEKLNKLYILNKRLTHSQKNEFCNSFEKFKTAEALKRFLRYKRRFFKKELTWKYRKIENIIEFMISVLQGSECSIEYAERYFILNDSSYDLENFVNVYDDFIVFRKKLVKYKKILKDVKNCKSIDFDILGENFMNDLESGELNLDGLMDMLTQYFSFSYHFERWYKDIAMNRDENYEKTMKHEKKKVYKQFQKNFIEIVKIKEKLMIDEDSLIEDMRKELRKLVKINTIEYVENSAKVNYMMIILQEIFDRCKEVDVNKGNLEENVVKVLAKEFKPVVVDPPVENKRTKEAVIKEVVKKEDLITEQSEIKIYKRVEELDSSEKQYRCAINNFKEKFKVNASLMSCAAKSYSKYVVSKTFEQAVFIANYNYLYIKDEDINEFEHPIIIKKKRRSPCPTHIIIEVEEFEKLAAIIKNYYVNMAIISIVFELKYVLNNCKNINELDQIKTLLIDKLEKLELILFGHSFTGILKTMLKSSTTTNFDFLGYRNYFVDQFNTLFINLMYYQRSLLLKLEHKAAIIEDKDDKYVGTMKLFFEEIELIIFCHFRITMFLPNTGRFTNKEALSTYFEDCVELFPFINMHKASKLFLFAENYSTKLDVKLYNNFEDIEHGVNPYTNNFLFFSGLVSSFLTFFIYKYFF